MTMLDDVVERQPADSERVTRAICDPLQMPLTAREWTDE
jgi:hypothetical protein